MNFILQTRKKNLNQTTYFSTDQLQEIDRTINVLSTGIEVLNEDLKRIGNEYVQCQNKLLPVLQKLPMIKKSIDEENTFVDSMKPNQENIERDILSTTQKFNEIKTVSYDGTYIWKISNVQERMG